MVKDAIQWLIGDVLHDNNVFIMSGIKDAVNKEINNKVCHLCDSSDSIKSSVKREVLKDVYELKGRINVIGSKLDNIDKALDSNKQWSKKDIIGDVNLFKSEVYGSIRAVNDRLSKMERMLGLILKKG